MRRCAPFTSPNGVGRYAFSGELAYNPYADALKTPSGADFRFAIPSGCESMPAGVWPSDPNIFQAPLADGSDVSLPTLDRHSPFCSRPACRALPPIANGPSDRFTCP